MFHDTVGKALIASFSKGSMPQIPSDCEPEDLTRLLRKFQVRFIEVAFQSLDGETRSRFFRADSHLDFLEGFRVDGYSVGFKPVEDSDLVVVPDPRSLKVYCLDGRCFGFLVGDLFYGSEPYPLCPRKLLRDLVSKMQGEVLVGLELELYLLEGGKPIDNRRYWAPDGRGLGLLLEAVESVRSGVEVRSLHHEAGPGQYEVLAPPSDPLTAADNAVFLKRLIKTVAITRGFTATFMAKPFSNLPGSGMHVHVSAKLGGGKPLLEDGELTEEGRWFIGGLLAYSRALSSLANQTVNSFKRLAGGMEAPSSLSWGFGNRSVLVRIPRSRKCASSSLEYRQPDASGNIYLAVAATLVAGLRGLEERLDPGPPLEACAYTVSGLARVPLNLGEALHELQAARALRELPKSFLEQYRWLKEKEWREYTMHCGNPCDGVTAWELEKYIDR